MQTEEIIHVAPEALLVDNVSRFGLRKSRIDQLMTEIMEQGEVTTPLDVELLSSPVNSLDYRIVDGAYRHAAVTRLNTEKGAGLTLPIRTHPESDPVSRLKRSISFNLNREDPSPMDMGIAIKALLDAGVSRKEIMDIYRRSGGRKGDKVQPASNSYLNMMVSFLDFPKKIQDLIHNRVLGTGAAYSLHKKPRDKWEEIINSAMDEREEADKAEVAADEKLLAEARKEEAAKSKVEDLRKEKEVAAEKLKLAAADLDKAAHEEVEAFSAAKKAKNNDEKKVLDEAFKAKQAASKDATTTAEAAKKEAEKIADKLAKVEQAAEERAKKLADARKADKKGVKAGDGKKPVSPKGIENAAAKAGTGTLVKLTATQMREAVHDWGLPGGDSPVITQIFLIVKRCFDSEITPSQAFKEMNKAVLVNKAKK